MEEQFAAEDAIDGDHGDEDEDVEMDFGEETGSEGTSATDEDEDEQEDPDEDEGDSEEDWHDEDEDEDLLEEDVENRAPEADGQIDPDVDVDGVWEVWQMLFPPDGTAYAIGCRVLAWRMVPQTSMATKATKRLRVSDRPLRELRGCGSSNCI